MIPVRREPLLPTSLPTPPTIGRMSLAAPLPALPSEGDVDTHGLTTGEAILALEVYSANERWTAAECFAEVRRIFPSISADPLEALYRDAYAETSLLMYPHLAVLSHHADFARDPNFVMTSVPGYSPERFMRWYALCAGPLMRWDWITMPCTGTSGGADRIMELKGTARAQALMALMDRIRRQPSHASV